MESQTNHNKRHHNQKYWQAHISALSKSGLSRAEYCRQHKLSYHAIIYWYKKFSTPAPNTSALIPVSIQQNVARRIMPVSQANLKIILPGKLSVEVGDNFSAETLTRLLTTLGCK